MKIQLEPVRGMRDLIPPDSEGIKILVEKFEKIARAYGYSYISPPTVELFSLFAMKSGPEISRSMYVFSDKAGREVCLRPEFTASVARMYLKHFRAEPKPIKVFYVGNAFRYEEPQFARYREFIQAGIEYIGDESIYSDIEQLLMIRDYYSEIGLYDYAIKMGSVGVIRSLLRQWSVPDKVQDHIMHLMDKKMVDEVKNVLKTYENADLDLFEDIVTFRTEKPEELESWVNRMNINDQVKEQVLRLCRVLKIIKDVGMKRVYVDMGFARGLAYYTGFIFEIETPSINVSIGGGGRYDGLIELYGGPKTPATGFSLGIDRTYLALKELGIVIKRDLDRLMLISLIEDVKYVDKIATRLRNEGLIVNARFVSGVKLGDVLSVASKKGYDYVGIVGEKEMRENKVTIKNLKTKVQKLIDVDAIGVGELP
jgi:histidyl-tRNA synthetase